MDKEVLVKTKNKDKKTQQLPKISRFITERKEIPVILLTIALTLFVCFMLFDLKQKINMAYSLEVEKEQILNEIKDWEKKAAKYPDYSDIYLKLSILEYRVGNNRKASYYLNKALLINPNSKQARNLDKFFLEIY